MKRDAGVELLDGALNDPAVLRDNLRDMGRANRLTGGTVLSLRAIAALAPRDGALSILDVGTGGADIPVALLADPRFRSRVTVIATDSRPEVLDAARAARPGLDRINGLRLEVADGRALPYADGTFDVAHASLVLHHVEPTDAARFLRELARVARRGVVVNDLSRRPITVLGAWLLSRACTHNRYSRHDAPLSARRAYTFDEAMTFVLAAGLRPVYSTEFVFGHRWAIAAVRR
ncbi:MAG TPA: methyltransferase domain-containing protein [Candidatus Limnocylindria bacterium]|nr:methyltransferase domain-containing protein [Candidatus Limnocylindria bacterium]